MTNIKSESIFEAIESLEYENKDDIVMTLMGLNGLHSSNNLKAYTTFFPGQGKLLVLKKTFVLKIENKVTKKINEYSVSVLVYLKKSYPKDAPEVYMYLDKKIDLTKILVNTENPYINRDTFEVKTKMCFMWDKTSNLNDLLLEIESSFSNNFPIATSDKKMTNFPNSKCFLKSVSQIMFLEEGNEVNHHIGKNNNRPNPNSNPNQNQVKNNQVRNPYNDINDIFNSSSQKNENKNKYDPILLQSVFERDNQIKNQIKTIIINEIINSSKNTLSTVIKDKNDDLLKLENEKNNLTKNISWLKNYIEKQKNIQTTLDEKIESFKKQIETLTQESKNLKEESQINFSNLSSYANEIALSNNGELLNLVSIELSIEELIYLVKKLFSKSNQSIAGPINLIRSLSKELFKVKMIQKKYLNSN